MLNRSASLAMSTSVLKALPGKPDIKRHSPSILYFIKHSYSINGGPEGLAFTSCLLISGFLPLYECEGQNIGILIESFHFEQHILFRTNFYSVTSDLRGHDPKWDWESKSKTP